MTDSTNDWRMEIYDCLREHDIEQVCHVPDAGHAALIRACEADNSMTVIGLTSEQDGVGVLTGAWLGGQRGVLLMQSSGVGNTINALAMPNACRIPFVTIVSMRGEWGEFVPWQIPMGQATPDVFNAMGVTVYRADNADEVAETVTAAIRLAFDGNQQVAVLLAQRLIGTKDFRAARRTL